MKFDAIERGIIYAALKVILSVVLGSLAGCGAVMASPDSSAVQVDISISDADWDTFQPKPKDDLRKEKAGDAPVAAVPVPVVSSKPQVQLFVTDGCPPCVTAKRELGKSTIPYYLMPSRPKWAEAKGFPALAWKAGNDWHYWHGWTAIADFEKHYNSTFRLKATARFVPVQKDWHVGYGQVPSSWTWPGDLHSHLAGAHGVPESTLRGMTASQAARYHDALHEGRAAVQRPQRRRYSLARAGGCPTCP